MNTRDIEIMRRFKEDLVRSLPVRAVYVIGSRARGDADMESDLDVVVVIDGEMNRRIRNFISECAWEAGFESGVIVVPVVYSQSEWEFESRGRSLLVRAVEREGIAV
jgi:predicted nucleotidyltransferase